MRSRNDHPTAHRFWNQYWFTLEDLAQLLDLKPATLRRRVDRGAVPAPAEQYPSRWPAAQAWALFIAEHSGATASATESASYTLGTVFDAWGAVPPQYWPAPAGAIAVFAGAEPPPHPLHGVTFVYTDARGVFRLCYLDDYLDQRRLLDAYPGEFVCVVTEQIPVDGTRLVNMFHDSFPGGRAEISLGGLATTLRTTLPFVPWNLRRPDAFRGWHPEHGPVTINPGSDFTLEELHSVAGTAAFEPLQQLWDHGRHERVVQSREYSPAREGIAIAARALDAPDVERPTDDDLYTAYLTSVGRTAETASLCRVVYESCSIRHTNDQHPAVRDMLHRMRPVPADHATLAHLYLEKSLADARGSDPSPVQYLRHDEVDLIAATTRGGAVAILLSARLLAAGFDALDVTQADNPMYRTGHLWLPVPHRPNDQMNVGYDGSGPRNLASYVTQLLEEPPAGTQLRWRSGPHDDAFTRPGMERVYTRADLHELLMARP